MKLPRRSFLRLAAGAAAFPAISTVGQTPTLTGALNGSGGDGWGTPVAGLGMVWIAHVPMIWSPMTIAGVPISVQLDQ